MGLPYGTTRQERPLATWEERLTVFPTEGEAGITVSTGENLEFGGEFYTLICRDADGKMIGFLLQYVTGPDPGCIVLQVDPARQREGIATALWTMARVLGLNPRITGQRLTEDGEGFINHLIERGRYPEPCTGVAAIWCPNHGNCRCPDVVNHRGGGLERPDLSDESCPLHSWASDHAEPGRV